MMACDVSPVAMFLSASFFGIYEKGKGLEVDLRQRARSGPREKG